LDVLALSCLALDPGSIASQSHAIATRLLRDRLGFDGVAMIDAMEAEAALASTATTSVQALRSLMTGADLLLMTGPGSFPLVRDAVIAAARRSPAVRAWVVEAAARVLVLRRRLL